MDMPTDQMTRVRASERNQDWPDSLAIVAHWRDGEKRIEMRIEITREEFFGLGSYGAPLSGDALVSRIDRLRRGSG